LQEQLVDAVPDLSHNKRLQQALWAAAAVLLVQSALMHLTAIVPLVPDWAEYIALARHLVEHGNIGFGDDWRSVPTLARSFQAFAYESDFAAFRPPGYPALLAVLGPGSGIETRIRWVLVVANAVAGGFLWDLTKQWRGNTAALLAVALWSVSPGSLSSLQGLAREPMLAPVALATLWLVLRAIQPTVTNRPLRLALVAGVVSGLGALVKETALVFVAATALWLLGTGWHRRNFRHWLVAAGLVGGATLAVAPWAIRNSVAQGRPVGLTTMGSVATVLALVDQGWPVPAPDPSLPPGSVRSNLDQAQRRTADFVRQQPVAATQNFLRNVRWYWSPWPRFSAANDWKAPAIGLFYSLVYAAAALTAIRHRRNDLVQLVVVALVLLGLAHGVSLATPRYRTPYEGLLYLLAAAYGSVWLQAAGRAIARRRAIRAE
jgi:hypothetical protein